MTCRACRSVVSIWILTVVAACNGSSSPPPTTPNPPAPTPTPLTLSAPTVVSPIDGSVANTLTPTLVLRAATGSDQTAAVSYEIQVRTANDELAYERTVPGGAANGQAMVSHPVETALARWRTYRWRARAVSGTTSGPWSDSTPINAAFATTRPNASTTEGEFREFFFDLINLKAVGPNATQQGLGAMEADLNAAGVILAKEVSGFLRGRIYLPTGNAADKYARSVDVVSGGFGPGFPWVWIFRGRTTCEGICP